MSRHHDATFVHVGKVTTDFVVDETLTLIRFRFGLAAARAWWQQIEGSGRLRWERVESDRFERARNVFFQYRDKDLSFIDCTSVAIYTDRHLGAPARWIAAKTASGAPSFLYHFSYVPASLHPGARGASHGQEIPFVFDSWDHIPGLTPAAETREVTRVMHACWIAFARTGRPACDGAPPWPRYSPTRDELMECGGCRPCGSPSRRAQLDAQDVAEVQREQRDSIAELLAMPATAIRPRH